MLADFILRSTGSKEMRRINAICRDGCLGKSLCISAHQLEKKRKFFWGALMQKLHNEYAHIWQCLSEKDDSGCGRVWMLLLNNLIG